MKLHPREWRLIFFVLAMLGLSMLIRQVLVALGIER